MITLYDSSEMRPMSRMHRYRFYLVIYDVADDKSRRKIAKTMEGFGVRVQKSAFEVWLDKHKYEKMVKALESLCTSEDSVRIYRIIEPQDSITAFGDTTVELDVKEVILV